MNPWIPIRSAMERNGVRSITELSRITGIKAPTLTQTRRKKPLSFIWYEILQIDKKLHFTEAEWRMLITRGEA